MSRLKKLKKLENKKEVSMTKTSSSSMVLNSSILKSGDVIGISVRVVNWKPWFQVYLEYEAGASSSFYDGPDADRAFKMYADVLLAFKGVFEAEKFNKELDVYKTKIEKMVDTGNNTKEYYNLILKQPKFLGINNF
ncbi:hypothetical protein D3C81_500680 [compost metagenome]